MAAANALLGTEVEQENGSLYDSFSGEAGKMVFSRGGEFNASLTGEEAVGEDLSKEALKLLKEIGFNPWEQTEVARLSVGVYQVTAYQKVFGVRSYSAQVRLTYENYILTTIEGVWFTATPSRVGDTACISGETALVAFLNSQERIGWLCNNIVSVEQSYVKTQTPSGATRLTPVWEIQTDTGRYEVNGITCAVQSA